MANPVHNLRVLHLVPDFWPNTGGMESFIGSLIHYGRAIGIDGRVLTMNRTAQHRQLLPQHEAIGGIDIRRLEFLDLKYYKPLKLPLAELGDADILHVHGIGAMLDAAVFLRRIHGKPIVFSTHGGIFHTQRLAAVKAAYFRVVRRWVLPRVTRIVASSRSDLALFAASDQRTVLIENGVDLAPFRSASDNEGPARDIRRLLFVGRHSPNKRLDRLLAAFAAARATGVDLRLRLVGPGDDGRDAARRTARELNIESLVEFAGEIAPGELPAEFWKASVFVSASEHEGFGIAAIEAMSAGCVTALSNIPAYRPLAESGGATLVDFTDASHAGKQLAAIACTANDASRASARASAERFDWGKTIVAWRGLYDSIN